MIRSLGGGGYFYVIRFAHENDNGNRMTKGMWDFVIFVNHTFLRDSLILNAKFTWTNS